MKIGVSSQNFRTITGHAGKGRRFIVYELDAHGEVKETDRIDLPKSMSMHETPVQMPHPLDQLDILITGGSGVGFVRKMRARNVKVITTCLANPIEAVTHFAKGTLLPLAESVQHAHSGHGEGHRVDTEVQVECGDCGCHQH